MARRLDLHEKFCDLLGTRNVYFQPPESIKIKYDAIVYKVQDRNDLRADNIQYRNLVGYEVSFITRDPDSNKPDTILQSFEYVTHNRTFTVDNLHHEVFTIFY